MVFMNNLKPRPPIHNSKWQAHSNCYSQDSSPVASARSSREAAEQESPARKCPGRQKKEKSSPARDGTRAILTV